MSISVEFQTRLKELVEELDEKTKSLAAQKIGINYLTFAKAYNYGIIPRPVILMKMADCFNVSVEYLLSYTDNEYFKKSDVPITFQERFESLRKAQSLTTYELAQRLHIHRNNLLQWIKKDYIPTLDDLVIIADYFEVSLDYLLGRTDDSTPYKDSEGDT